MLLSLPCRRPLFPLGGEHHEVERVRGLHLEPLRAAAAGFVGRARRLRHDPLVPERKRFGQEALRRARVARHELRHAAFVGYERRERLAPRFERPIDEVHAVGVKHVEEKCRKRQLAAELFRVVLPSKAPHRHLKRLGPAVARSHRKISPSSTSERAGKLFASSTSSGTRVVTS